MAVKSMQVLVVGLPDKVNKGEMTFMDDYGKIVEAPHLAFLIRADEGNVLVDSGMHPAEAEMFASWAGIKLHVPEEVQLPYQLKQVGLQMKDINMVIHTHLHIDHIGWSSELKNAEIVVQKMEYLFALEPPYTDAARFPARYNAAFRNMKWKIVDGDTILFPGLAVLFTPGHSIGHQSVMVDLPKTGTIILAGDAADLQENLDKELIPSPWASGREAYLSIKKINTMAKVRKAIVFPGHDMEYYNTKMKKSPEAYY